MMQSVRERIPELAVLKTYGYSNARVTAFVIAEALALCGAAAGLGLWMASLISPQMFSRLGAGELPLPTNVLVVGFVLAAAVAAVSALIPALRVQRMNIVDALAGR
jgi:putative ABC transport system permease protein